MSTGTSFHIFEQGNHTDSIPWYAKCAYLI